MTLSASHSPPPPGNPAPLLHMAEFILDNLIIHLGDDLQESRGQMQSCWLRRHGPLLSPLMNSFIDRPADTPPSPSPPPYIISSLERCLKCICQTSPSLFHTNTDQPQPHLAAQQPAFHFLSAAPFVAVMDGTLSPTPLPHQWIFLSFFFEDATEWRWLQSEPFGWAALLRGGNSALWYCVMLCSSPFFPGAAAAAGLWDRCTSLARCQQSARACLVSFPLLASHRMRLCEVAPPSAVAITRTHTQTNRARIVKSAHRSYLKVASASGSETLRSDQGPVLDYFCTWNHLRFWKQVVWCREKSPTFIEYIVYYPLWLWINKNIQDNVSKRFMMYIYLL